MHEGARISTFDGKTSAPEEQLGYLEGPEMEVRLKGGAPVAVEGVIVDAMVEQVPDDVDVAIFFAA